MTDMILPSRRQRCADRDDRRISLVQSEKRCDNGNLQRVEQPASAPPMGWRKIDHTLAQGATAGLSSSENRELAKSRMLGKRLPLEAASNRSLALPFSLAGRALLGEPAVAPGEQTRYKDWRSHEPPSELRRTLEYRPLQGLVMADAMQLPPDWIQKFDFLNAALRPGVSSEAITTVEQRFGIWLPDSYCQLMRFTDGMRIPKSRNSVELHSVLDVDAVNVLLLEDDPAFPLLQIGEVEDEDGRVGFMKDAIKGTRINTCPVWHFINGEFCCTASSFEEFIADLLRIKPDGAYESSMPGDPICLQLDRPPPLPTKCEAPWWQFWKGGG